MACTYILVCVPVQGGILEDEPVLFPFLGEVTLGILFLPEPALAVAVAQVLAGDSPPAHAGQGTPWDRASGEMFHFPMENVHFSTSISCSNISLPAKPTPGSE